MRFTVVLLVAVSLLLQGCFLAPGIDAFQRMGMTASDREQKFARDSKEYQEFLYWGKPRDALRRVAPESREVLDEVFRDEDKRLRFVEAEIEDVHFNEDAREANAEVRVKYYSKPTLAIEERLERQNWRFEFSNGWLLVSRNIVRPDGTIYDVESVGGGAF